MIASLTRTPDGDWANAVETVNCVLEDDGSHTISTAAWSGWSAGQLVYVQLGRVKTSGATMPQDDGRSSAVGIFWTLGAFITQ